MDGIDTSNLEAIHFAFVWHVSSLLPQHRRCSLRITRSVRMQAGMPNVRVRKKKPWHYAFVTLEDETKLKEQELFFKKAKVQAQTGVR